MILVSTNVGTVEAAVASMLRGDLADTEILEMFETMAQRPFTIEDLVGGARAMRAAMIRVDLQGDPIDTCGTGGSGKKTINTSTLVAFVVAAAGGNVAKHGNKSASGNCGSFDLLEALGARIDLMTNKECDLYDTLGIVFLYARTHHPAMKHVASARKTFGRQTLFNLLGPLCNPAGVHRQIIGAANADHAQLLAGALRELGTDGSAVVYGEDGLDECSVCALSRVHFVNGKEEFIIDPRNFGVSYYDPKEIDGGNSEQNCAIFRAIAAGRGTGAQNDLVALNAGLALHAAGRASTIIDGVRLARDILASGTVLSLVNRYIRASNDVA